jgi:DNA excision repair protein ERCC-2
MVNENIIKISVRNLVEYVLRSGDIDTGFATASRALEGAYAHRKIQKSYAGRYTPEVTLSFIVENPDITLEVRGRADGIIVEDSLTILDEIKTTTGSIDQIDEESNPLFWAQAKVYAFIFAYDNKLTDIDVQLTYYQLEDRETKIFRKHFTFDQLKDFFNDLIQRYLYWARKIRDWTVLRNAAIDQLEFPFQTYRPGQREMAVSVYRSLVQSKCLFAQAPTGIGKTLATLFPSIKAIGEDHVEKIFYLTARNTAAGLAEDTLTRLRNTGLRFKAVTLTAKEKICFKEACDCRPETCEFAKGHFDRIKDAIEDAFEYDALTRTTIETFARKHRVCPFEFALDLSLWADAIIGDYNYVFDPKVCLKRFFNDTPGRYVFLVDEAHNLVDRAREMFSTELTKQAFLDLRTRIKPHQPKIATALGKINSAWLEIKKECEPSFQERGSFVQKEPSKLLMAPIRKFIKIAEAWLAKNEAADFSEDLLTLYFQAIDFVRVSETYDSHFATYVEPMGKDLRIKLFCLDPSKLLQEAIQRGKSAIFFSATLTPLDYFKNILGGQDSDNRIKIPSPFPEENFCLLVADTIRTTFKARKQTLDQVVDAIATVVSSRRGNYLAYFPSYEYLRSVSERFHERYPACEVLCQTTGMTDTQRQDFLARFSSENLDTLVGFAVIGGIFGEGIDLVGDRLAGCVVVGVGLPQICLERDIIRDYFQETMNLGFEYAYMYPGMNKVLQAAGRVIRTETDRGVVLLIDQRFSTAAYRNLFPRHWSHAIHVRNSQQISDILKDFWQTSAPIASSLSTNCKRGWSVKG